MPDKVKIGDLFVPSVKRMPVDEFRELGLVQEINRRILHPLGLALEVTIAEDGTERLSGVWDYRDDPEGMVFGFNPSDDRGSLAAFQARAAAVERVWASRRRDREDRLGYMVQPLACEGEHEWGDIQDGYVYCGAGGCGARKPITDDEAIEFIWGPP